MYKVHINGVLTEISNHSFAIAVNGLTVSRLNFGDDIPLLDSNPSLQISMASCYKHSLTLSCRGVFGTTLEVFCP